MVGEEQLQGLLAVLYNSGGVGEDFHVGGDGIDAGGAQTAGALDLHHADPASADGVDVFEVAKGGNVDAGHSCCFQNGGTLGSSHFNAVNFDGILFHDLFLLTSC